jgi:NAD(P)-dependent dehydrogenase (short-subunit alcohol dehydrogenase family)
MSITNATVLITGANRGLGRALVDEALRRGAARVYAATRVSFAHPDPRVTPVALDITDAAQARAVAERIPALDVLVNNAGLSLFDDLSDVAVLERHLAVNLFGPYHVIQAFLPHLTRSRGAAVNVLSLASLAPLPIVPAYSVSKAAAMSLSQSLRALLAERGVRVHAVMAGPLDTEMSRDFDVPKAPVDAVARAIFDGVDAGAEEIFPDPLSATVADAWAGGMPKEMERQNAQYVAVGAGSDQG